MLWGVTRLAFAIQQNKTSLEQNEKCYSHSSFLYRAPLSPFSGFRILSRDVLDCFWFD